MTVAPPNPEFIPAKHKGGPQPIRAIVLHGTVSHDDPGTARAIARYFQDPPRTTSAHYVTDPIEDIQCVGDHTVAYHCGHNFGTIGHELCDEQTGPASRWDDADSQAIIARAARLDARLCLAYNIEPRRPTIAELKAKGPHGIYDHNDSRLAFGGTTHTDVRDFPWDTYFRLLRAEIAELTSAITPADPPHLSQAPGLVEIARRLQREIAARPKGSPQRLALVAILNDFNDFRRGDF